MNNKLTKVPNDVLGYFLVLAVIAIVFVTVIMFGHVIHKETISPASLKLYYIGVPIVGIFAVQKLEAWLRKRFYREVEIVGLKGMKGVNYEFTGTSRIVPLCLRALQILTLVFIGILLSSIVLAFALIGPQKA